MSRKILIACICIATSLLFLSTNALADLILAEGGPTGQWFNPERNGEGFYVEIINTGGNQQIGIAMYSFDADGDQLWVVGNVPIGPDDEVVQVPVFQFNGPSWGADFDSDDLNTIEFGSITVRFPTCDTALFSVAVEPAVGLSGGSYSLIRLTDIEGVTCVEPPSAPTGITPGHWAGLGVCFMVSEDGMSIRGGELSECDAQNAFDSNLDGVSNELNECNVTADCELTWDIVNGSFACVNNTGTLAIGTFSSRTSASGFAFEPEGGRGEYCTADWTATPVQ
jgi:hypothetical protein